MDQEEPTNVQIMTMLANQQARADEQQAQVDEQQRRLAQQEVRTAQLEAENAQLKAEAQRVEARAQRVEAEVEQQRLEKVSLTSRVNEVEGGAAPHDKKLTRAGLFKAAAMGSAAVVGAGALSTLGAENAAAATFDTNFVAIGTNVTGFDARGTAAVGVNTNGGTFTFGGSFYGSGVGAEAVGTGASSKGLYAAGGMYGAQLSSNIGVPLYLVAGTSAGSPTTGTHNPGEIYVDTNARIFHCVTGGSPGTWVPLNALAPITPVRVLDTRSGTQVGTSTGPFATGTTLTFAIAGQTFTTSSGTFTFPSNIVGVVGNLVAVTPTGAGYLIAFPQGVTRPTAASVNFVPPGTGSDIYYAIGNNVTVGLSASGQVSIYMGLVAGASVQLALDISGYLV